MRGKMKAMIFNQVLSALAFLVLLMPACSQTPAPADTAAYVLGPVSWQQWQQTAGWESYSADDYTPDVQKAEEMKALAEKDEAAFYLFSGSWCSDSKSEVPKIFKLMNLAGISPDKIKLIGVDRQKSEPTGTAGKFNIERVPTLVVVKSGAESGRVIEYPRPGLSWEDEILMLLSK